MNFVPTDVSELTQLQGRTARQGAGIFGIVLSAAEQQSVGLEVDGQFYRNLKNYITLAGVNSSFRNSSVFRQYAVDKSHELEVDALLDHLFPCSSFLSLQALCVLHPICCGCLPM